MMCPKCKHKFPSPVAMAGGRIGGKARVPKGFASAAVQRKAQITLREIRNAEKSMNKWKKIAKETCQMHTGNDGYCKEDVKCGE